MSSLLTFIANIHVARHVDIDGIRQESDHVPNDLYSQTVDKARVLVRTLEAVLQSLFDDSIALLLTIQSVRELEPGQSRQDRDTAYDYIDVISTSLKSNLVVVQKTMEALLSVGHDQADMAQGDYNGSIEWRMSRLSVIDTQFGGVMRPMSSFLGTYDVQGEDLVDMEVAFSRQGSKGQGVGDPAYDATLHRTLANGSEPTFNGAGPSGASDFESTTDETMVAPESPDMQPDIPEAQSSPLFDDDREFITFT